MGQIFGKTSRRESDNESVFSPNYQPREEKEETEAAETKGEQTREEEGQSVEPEVEESEEVQGGQVDNEIEEEQTEDEDEDKLAGKFTDRTSLLGGIQNLGEKLGRKLDPVKVQSSTTAELVEVYEDLHKELGRTSDIDKTRQENQQLKEQLNQYEQEIQQTKQQMNRINQYLLQLTQRQQMSQQQMQQPQQTQQNMHNNQQQLQQNNNLQRDPNTGQFVPRNQQQDNQSAPDQSGEQIDPDKWLREFYKNPVEAVKKINQMNNQQQMKVKQNMNQQEKQDLRAQQQQIEQQKAEQYRNRLEQIQSQHFSAKTQEMTQKYGEDFDNEETKREIVKYMKRHPAYLNPNLFPNGIEIAYKEIKKRQQNRQNTQNQNIDNEDIVNQKKAAQLPKSQGSNVRGSDDSDNAQQIKKQIFGGRSGIFGK